jgi:hypothetical protein
LLGVGAAGIGASRDGEDECEEDGDEERRRNARRRVLGESSERDAMWNVWSSRPGAVSARRFRRRREPCRRVSDENVSARWAAAPSPRPSGECARPSTWLEIARRRIAGDGIGGSAGGAHDGACSSFCGLGGDVAVVELGGEGG